MRGKLQAYIQEAHKGQVRKYTGDPYFTHLLAVAEMAEKTNAAYGWEIGLCHDLLEDIDPDPIKLKNALKNAGYNIVAVVHIISCVIALTDVYTKEAFPELNRAQRKHLECIRLSAINQDAQTVKYCDLIHNTKSIVKHDPSFAKKYLPEKQRILEGMNRGDAAMYSKCLDTLNEAYKQLDLI